MFQTTLCYLERDGKWLMLHRVKKENDLNEGKWVGIGGKFEEAESPEDCAVREIREETGLRFSTQELRYRAVVTFVSDEWGTEYMHLFTASADEEKLSSLRMEKDAEGVLEWVPISEVARLPIWEGDKIFLQLLVEDSPFFSLKLEYRGDTLISYTLYR